MQAPTLNPSQNPIMLLLNESHAYKRPTGYIEKAHDCSKGACTKCKLLILLAQSWSIFLSSARVLQQHERIVPQVVPRIS